MSNYLFTVFKGLYPVYFFLFILGVWHRGISRKWMAFDTFLLVSFLLFESLASLQVPLFYGIAATSKRYLWVGLPLCLPLAADGLLWLLKLFAWSRGTVRLAAVLLLAMTGVNVYNACSPIMHESHSVKKSRERLLSREAALWISRDWKNDHTLRGTLWKCDQYQSGKRPLVQSDWERVGYLCGGQDYPAFFAVRNIMPDYIVTRSSREYPGCILVQKISTVHIWKNSNPVRP